jgi:hypothetical protein
MLSDTKSLGVWADIEEYRRSIYPTADASFWVSDTFGPKSTLIHADIIFIAGSLL